jgi:predicted phosphodiesterase
MKVFLERIKLFFKKRRLLSILLTIFVVVLFTGLVYAYNNIKGDFSFGSHKNDQISEESSGNVAEFLINYNPDGLASIGTSGSDSNNPSISSGSSSSSSTSSSGSSTTSDSSDDGGVAEPPADESPSATVAFYADNQSDTDDEDQNHRRIVDYIFAAGANPVFHVGDLMEDGTQASFDRFVNIAGGLLSSRTFYGALGNNDRKIGDSSTPSPIFLNYFSFPNNEQWYSVNIGNLHMVVLDSAFSSASSSQYNWLISDLQSAASQSKITGVMFHHPIYPNNDKGMRVSYEPVFVNNGVDFVISGHNHAYYHSTISGINYFVTSGQPSLGYFIAKVYSDVISFIIYNNSNSVVDSVSFSER